MNSHCLYCGKRLSFFHGKKKPYCSDVHEDRYLERQSRTALDRLQSDLPAVTHPSPAGLPPPLSPPKLPESHAQTPESYSYEQVDPAVLNDEDEVRGSDDPRESSYPQAPAPPAPLIADRSGIKAAPPAFDLRDAGEAAFPPQEWDVAPVMLTLEDAQIEPAPMTFAPPLPAALVEPQLVEPQLIEPQFEPPAAIFDLAPLRTWPLTVKEAIGIRVFCAPSLSLTVPGLKLEARHSALAPVAARAPQSTSTLPAPVQERLPETQPLRFRTLLDLHNPIFHPAKRRIALTGKVLLEWNAIAPEAEPWRSTPARRPIVLMLPKLPNDSSARHNPGDSRHAIAAAGGPDQ